MKRAYAVSMFAINPKPVAGMLAGGRTLPLAVDVSHLLIIIPAEDEDDAQAQGRIRLNAEAPADQGWQGHRVIVKRIFTDDTAEAMTSLIGLGRDLAKRGS